MIRDPIAGLELNLAKQKAEDFAWAFTRLIELVAEEADPHGPQVSAFMLGLVERAMERLSEENQVRQAQANEEFNRG